MYTSLQEYSVTCLKTCLVYSHFFTMLNVNMRAEDFIEALKLFYRNCSKPVPSTNTDPQSKYSFGTLHEVY